MPRTAIAVIGAGTCDAETANAAYRIGQLVAQHGLVLVTGGRTGVMEAASRGARDAGGLVVGILPGADPAEANDAVEVAIPTGMGQLRNGLVVSSAAVVIAVAGEWGTLSEIGFALKIGKPVIGWHSWDPIRPDRGETPMVCAATPEDAVEQALARAGI